MGNNLIGIITDFDNLIDCAILLNKNTAYPIDIFTFDQNNFLLVTSNLSVKIDKCFLLHKKETTYYTINALNQLIREINNGVLDRNMQIDWSGYSDMLLLTSKNQLLRYKLNFFKRI